MNLPEQTALVLFASRSSFIQAAQIKHWALSAIEKLANPPLWLIEIATNSSDTVDDHFVVLSENSGDLPLRRILQVIILNHANGALPFPETLKLLFKAAFLDWEGSSSLQDEPLKDALVEWDCLDDLEQLPPGLEARLRSLFADYLTDSGEVGRVLGCRLPDLRLS